MLRCHSCNTNGNSVTKRVLGSDYLEYLRDVLAINQTATYSSRMTTQPLGDLADTDTQIASRITNALVIRNVTMLSLSEKTGISYPTLRRSLSGGRSLTFNEFCRIAKAIDLQPSSLLPESISAKEVAA